MDASSRSLCRVFSLFVVDASSRSLCRGVSLSVVARVWCAGSRRLGGTCSDALSTRSFCSPASSVRTTMSSCFFCSSKYSHSCFATLCVSKISCSLRAHSELLSLSICCASADSALSRSAISTCAPVRWVSSCSAMRTRRPDCLALWALNRRWSSAPSASSTTHAMFAEISSWESRR